MLGITGHSHFFVLVVLAAVDAVEVGPNEQLFGPRNRLQCDREANQRHGNVDQHLHCGQHFGLFAAFDWLTVSGKVNKKQFIGFVVTVE